MAKTLLTTIRELDIQENAVIFNLEAEFQWVYEFPVSFFTGMQKVSRGKTPWKIESLDEVVTYLNLFKNTTNLKMKTKIRKQFPKGVDVLNRPHQISLFDLQKARSSLQKLYSEITRKETLSNKFLLYTPGDQNVLLFYTPPSDKSIGLNFQECMLRLKEYNEHLFDVIHNHTITYLKDMAVQVDQDHDPAVDYFCSYLKNMGEDEDKDPSHDSNFYHVMNRNCNFTFVYYPKTAGGLLSHVDSVLGAKVHGDSKNQEIIILKRDGPIYTLNLNCGDKYTDLFPVWQPDNSKNKSKEPAYRLKTYFGHTTKLSGLDGRYRMSHGIPSGNDEEGYTAVWKFNEPVRDNLKMWSDKIKTFDTGKSEYHDERIRGAAHIRRQKREEVIESEGGA
jgi:hypothetical protein